MRQDQSQLAVKPRYPVVLAVLSLLATVWFGISSIVPAAASISCGGTLTITEGSGGSRTVSLDSPAAAFIQIVSVSGPITASGGGQDPDGGSWSATVSVSSTGGAGSGSVTVRETVSGENPQQNDCTFSVTINPTTTTTTTTTTTRAPTTTTRAPTTTAPPPTTTTTTTTTTTEPPTTTTATTTSTTTSTTTTTTPAPTTTTATTTTTAAPTTTTTPAAAPPPPGGGDSDGFIANNWWWLTIVGLTLITLIATIAILQPQRQVANGGAHVAGRNNSAGPSMSQRVRRSRVAQNISQRAAQPKAPKPSLWRRMTNRIRDTELADSFRARSEAKQVRNRTTRKPPKIKRHR